MQHSKMATCKRHKGHLHESIWTPQLGLAPRLALLLFLIGKKPRLQEAVMLAPQADPVVVVPKYRLNLFLIGKKPRLQEAVMLAPRADPVVVVPKYRLNLSGLFTPNWSDAPELLSFARPATRQPWLLVCVSSFGGHPSSLEPQECDPGATSHGHQLRFRDVETGSFSALLTCLESPSTTNKRSWTKPL
ncbi:hypothetical protein V5799_005057 [Amblyomma americanum]|uniref:Uncharacterized protein n=1 Tax=Amblyomma americanum TaxID=6943 RepID=A0AAQ4D4C1_AMBAM